MLKKVSKILTGDLLKALCDMGHGDELVIADANFPAETCAKRLIRMPGLNGVSVTDAILDVFPLDTYSDPAVIMDLTDSDKEKGMANPIIWDMYQTVLCEKEKCLIELTKIERYDFYERAKNAYLVVQTGEERQYGNLLLVKGVIL